MGAPKGNQYAKGNRGSNGRPPAHVEKANAELLRQLFFEDTTIEDIKEKLKTGRYSLKDVFISKAFAGNERFLSDIVRKLFPDSLFVDHTSGGKALPRPILTYVRGDNSNAQSDGDDQENQGGTGGNVSK